MAIRETDKEAKDAETEADREKEMEAPPPPPGREMDRDTEEGDREGQEPRYPARGGWTITAQLERDKGKLLMKPPVRLPGRELEKWRCQEHGTGCWGRTKPDCSKALSP